MNSTNIILNKILFNIEKNVQEKQQKVENIRNRMSKFPKKQKNILEIKKHEYLT